MDYWKLIDLLNEYDEYAFPEKHPHTEYPDWWVDDWDYWYLWHEYILWQQEWLNFSHHASIKNSSLNHLYVISKEFWFIKRLVDNDKIDLDKVEKKFYYDICLTDYWDTERAYWKSDLVISVLSISDNPIEDLCKLLK